MMWVLLTLAAAVSVSAEFYDTFSGKPLTPAQIDSYNASGLLPWCAVDVSPCQQHEGRRVDGSCNNVAWPSRGAQLTPFRRLLAPRFGPNFDEPAAKSGAPLPNARRLRTTIMSDGRVSSTQYTMLLTHALVALAGEFTSTHDTINYVVVTRTCCEPGAQNDPRCLPIYVPEEDVYLRRTDIRCLNLTRPFTYQRLGCAPPTTTPERLNLAQPMLELSIVYGSSPRASQRARAGRGGELRAEPLRGKDWPPSGAPVCLLNDLAKGETRCHNSANVGVNTILGVNMVFLWWFRSHNAVARELARLNPCWTDERLYLAARDINIAMFQHVYYYETWTAVLGEEYLRAWRVIFPQLQHQHVDDYDASLEPRASVEFSIAMRWFHTMQEGRLDLYDAGGALTQRLSVVELTLRTGALADNDTLAHLTRGALAQPAARTDNLVDPDMGERALGNLQRASDVVASDLRKGRVGGLPSYVHYRRYCGLSVPTTFADLEEYMTHEAVVSLRMMYETVGDIELYAGLLTERGAVGGGAGERGEGGTAPETLACIIAEQLRHWRRADRFWFESPRHPTALTSAQLAEVRRSSWAWLLCTHGDGITAVQARPMFLPGPYNKVVPCEQIPSPSLLPWRDPQCSPHDAPVVVVAAPPPPPPMFAAPVSPPPPPLPTTPNTDFFTYVMQ